MSLHPSRPPRPRHVRRGLILAEPFIAAAVAVALAAIFVPAVLQSREAARRTECKYNLKSLGLAVANYHDLFGVYPPAMNSVGDTSQWSTYRGATTAAELAATEAGFGTTWTIGLLPYTDDRKLYEQVDFGRRLEDQPDVTRTHLTLLRCPSAGEPTMMIGSEANDTLPPGVAYARGNYGMNLGGGNANPIGPEIGTGRNGPFGQTVLGVDNRKSLNIGMGTSPQSRANFESLNISARSVIDGTESCILFGELLTDARDSTDSRGAWARGMGAIVSAYTRGKPSDGVAGIATPNASTIDRTDPAAPKLSIHADCPVFAASREGDPVDQITATSCPGFGENDGGGVAMRSRHPGGVNVCMASGKVFFLSEAIDPQVYRAMMTSAGGDDTSP